MRPIKEFKDFLEKHRVIKNCNGPVKISHTSMGNPMGSFFISPEENSIFLELYKKALKVDHNLHIIERHNQQSPILIDIDIKYRSSNDVRKYTNYHIESIIKFYNRIIEEFLDIKEENLQAYVMEKGKPSKINEEEYKDGFHIMYPFICTKPLLQYIMREAVKADVIKNSLFDDINPINNINDIIDESVIEKNGWMLYGSVKVDREGNISQKYELTTIYNNNLEKIEIDDDIDYLVSDLSIRKYKEDDITTYKSCWDDDKIEEIWKRMQPKTSKKRMKGSENDIRIAYSLVNMLNIQRADNYNKWIELGFCLHNIDDSLIELWIDFSKKSKKYKEGECQKSWATFRDDGLTIKTLHRWAKEDNPDEYGNFMLEELGEIMRKSTNGTSYDVAKAFFEMNKFSYVVASIKHKIWYYFDGNKWKEMDGAYKIISQLNEDMVNLYLKLGIAYASKATVSKDEEKQKMLDKQNECIKVSLKLRSSAFKETIIKELLTLYYDPLFYERLNESRHLICFNNGVYDVNLMLFREGRPEDYISLCTNVNYIEYTKDEQKIVDVENFMVEIQPEDDMREYVLRFLSSCLAGHAPDEKIHIWTGSGSNGKSLLVNLMMLSLGDYCTTLSISLLTQKRAASNAATPELADTKGKRFAVFQEPENSDQINVGHMKELTGNDKIKARALFKEPIEFYPQFKPVLTCNRLPPIPSSDGGTWRRIRVTPFEMKFVDNPKESYEKKVNRQLKELLPLWKEAFISILVEYYKKYKAEGLVEPEKVLQFTKRYEMDSDLYQEFFKSMIGPGDDNDYLTLTELHREFFQWYKYTRSEKTSITRNELKYEMEEKFKKRFIDEKIRGFKIVASVTPEGNIISKYDTSIEL